MAAGAVPLAFGLAGVIGLKIFSNYVNHVAQTDVDDMGTNHPDIQEMWPVLGKMDL